MSTELNKKLARNYFEAYNTGDIDAVMKFLGPNYVLHPGANGEPMNAIERKKDEAVFFRAFSDIQTSVDDQIAENGKVANRIRMSCTHKEEYQGVPATGKRVVIPYIDIVLIKKGKIIEEWVEYDSANILRQIKKQSP